MEIIKESFFEVIKDSIGISPSESIIPLKRGYLSSIEILGNNKSVFLLFNRQFLRSMCSHFLGDENPSKETLEDMAKELANLTAGHAKVIAQKRNQHFNISTPNFLGIRVISNYDSGVHFRLGNKGHCSIFLRKHL